VVAKPDDGWLAMNMIRKTVLLASLSFVSACQASTPKPAVISTDSDRQIIAKVVAEVLYRDHILLADNAFTEQNEITVTPRQLMGRELSSPEKFSLWLKQEQCVLVHADQEIVLPDVSCQEIAPLVK
jgi:hypothetical protein